MGVWKCKGYTFVSWIILFLRITLFDPYAIDMQVESIGSSAAVVILNESVQRFLFLTKDWVMKCEKKWHRKY